MTGSGEATSDQGWITPTVLSPVERRDPFAVSTGLFPLPWLHVGVHTVNMSVMWTIILRAPCIHVVELMGAPTESHWSPTEAKAIIRRRIIQAVAMSSILFFGLAIRFAWLPLRSVMAGLNLCRLLQQSL